MKTTFFVATMIALTAVSCSKTELSNDTPRMIGFSAETGKMTKAIQDNSTNVALTNSDFGVFSYSVTGEGSSWGGVEVTTSPIMDNIQITKNQADVWKASNGITYYWPNDASTKLTFFAYSPHKKAGVTVTKKDGITITDYEVVKTADDVDLMVADQATDKTYTNTTNGSVPLTFRHVLTQVLFTVKTDAPYAGITFTITGLNLSSITSNGTYKQKATPNVWTAATAQATEIYTYLTTSTTTSGQTAVNLGTAKALLPQTLATNTQKLNITYTISGTGVATETVSKSIDLHNATVQKWDPNMKVTYNLTIGLKGITFTPTVDPWTTPATNSDLTVQ